MAESIGYDPKLRTLEIEFKTGEIWQYDFFPEEMYQQMMNEGSFGTYFQKYIRPYFPGKRVNK